MTTDTSREELERILSAIGMDGGIDGVRVFDIETLADFIISQQSHLITQIKAEMPKKERVASNPNNEDRRMRTMWNRGFNECLEQVTALLDKWEKQ